MAKYIDKSALVTEIERRMKKFIHCMSKFYYASNYNGWKLVAKELISLISFINTLEVKEVDFEKELVEEIYSHIDSIIDTADRMTSGNFMHNRAAIKFSANTIAKVLELIDKAQKGEK